MKTNINIIQASLGFLCVGRASVDGEALPEAHGAGDVLPAYADSAAAGRAASRSGESRCSLLVLLQLQIPLSWGEEESGPSADPLCFFSER